MERIKGRMKNGKTYLDMGLCMVDISELPKEVRQMPLGSLINN